MDIRTTILNQLARVVTESSPLPFPQAVCDSMMLNDFYLDSVAFTSLLTGIEGEVGFIPSGILEGTAFPRTIGELIKAYEDEVLTFA